jgi:short-subunit dehydrogenase
MAQTVLITGSSSGIGRSAAQRFQQAGWNVAATMRSPVKETELNQHSNVRVLALDVTKPDTIRQAIEETIDAFGSIDAVINNAGYGLFGPFESATHEQIVRQYETNVFGVMHVTREILPHFREQGSGVILNNSSIAGLIGVPTISLYGSTKFAVEGLSESLYYELRELGIQVKIVEPGVVVTDFFGRSLDSAHNPTITAYNSTLERFNATLTSEDYAQMTSHVEQIAEVMFTAVTDGKDQLRYLVGKDAEMLWSQYRQLEEFDFLKSMRQQFLETYPIS